MSLLKHIKKLPGGKDALFARVKYFSDDVDLSDGKAIIKDVDDIEDDEQTDGKACTLQMLDEPLRGDCQVELVGFEDEEAIKAFRHSSAHILGAAIEKVYIEPHLTIGPPIQDGFYYDFFSPSGEVVRDTNEYKQIEKVMSKIVNQNLKFERLIVTR